METTSTPVPEENPSSLTPAEAAAEAAAESLFEQQVESTYDSISSLPDTEAIPRRTATDLLDKLRMIARLEGFEVENLLGRGGMGAVVVARDRQLGRMVALKFLSTAKSLDSNARATLKREAERTSRLAHENIVQVYSWHSVGDLTFFSMEYVDGVTLDRYMLRNPLTSPHDLVRIIAEASAGVAAAHEKGILHRDIKPQNILIASNGRVKVADFGLAKTTEDRWRETLGPVSISGTIGFMAPEQARGEKETPANDVFSLTATLYYALTGQMPFEGGGDSKAALKSNQQGKIVPLYTVRDDLPQPIYRVIAKGLSSDPIRRYKDAKELRRELESVMLELAVREDKNYYGRVFRAFCKRHSFALGILIGLGVGLLVGLWLKHPTPITTP